MSRERLEEARAEVRRLRLELEAVKAEAREDVARYEKRQDELVDRMTKLVRARSGLPEESRNGKVKRREPMPKELKQHFDSFADQTMAKYLRDQVIKRNQRGEPWEEIMAGMDRESR